MKPLMTRTSAIARVLLVFALVLGLGGCKTVGGWFGKDKVEETERLGVEDLYRESHDLLRSGSYAKAERYYQRLVARFPFGPYTEQATLELAYAQYKNGKPEDATSTLDRFIRTYPRHPHIDYAYYLKGVVNFDRDITLFTRALRLDMSSRDLGAPVQSINDFTEVIRRYPNSRYAVDARQRIVYLRNVLARHELNVGLYYFRRGAWVSATNRAKYLLETYPQSEYDGDAVALMAASYSKLGQQTLADDARRVLEKNYPQHPYLHGKWPRKKGVWRQLNPFSGEMK
jgi:outer membrane protein assembly factor BamD